MSALSIRVPHVRYGRSLPGFARVASFAKAVLDYKKHRVKKLKKQQHTG